MELIGPDTSIVYNGTRSSSVCPVFDTDIQIRLLDTSSPGVYNTQMKGNYITVYGIKEQVLNVTVDHGASPPNTISVSNSKFQMTFDSMPDANTLVFKYNCYCKFVDKGIITIDIS